MGDENKTLEAVREEITGVAKEIKGLLDTQSEEIKANGATSAKTAEELKAATERIDQYEADRKGLIERLEKAELEIQKPHYDGATESGMKMSPGMQFIRSKQYKDAVANQSTRTESVNVKTFLDMVEVKSDEVISTQPDTPVRPDRATEIFFDPGQRPLRLMDIMNVTPTMSDTIEFVVETDFDEDDAKAQSAQGIAKSQGTMDFELRSVSVSTIAQWIAASRQILADAPRLQGHIDGRLLYSVNKKAEDDLIFGDGTSGAMLGIWNTSGVVTVGAPGDLETEDTILDHIRRAIAKVRESEYNATGIILHPNDWADIELQKGDDDHYIWVTVPAGGTMQLWRVPVVESTVMEEGRFLTGAFGLGATVYDRQTSSIRISEHHEEFFTKNLIAILAELRIALTVERPKAFIRGTLNSEAET
jgi:HK97 family phage major capsid protein